ncbi:uncharacterized protein LOC143886293 [Tasmannia lanceolata]|uniref:uncharacterized protein LOC143886293 n=1 Tax=Tasmannia lanceolata TaxID=3420 RepID=UPI0040639AC4
MGKEITSQINRIHLESRPGIFVIGSPNVGKRTLLSRLLPVDLSDASDLSTEVLCHGWTIDTKYYTADISIWMAHLDDGFSFGALPISDKLAALVMVFDLNELSSFTALQDWVSSIDIQNFEILLCIGNKADLLPGHFAYAEYRRLLHKRGESSSDPHPEYFDYGILETEGSSLLGEKEPCWENRRACLEWCSLYNIEYIEACASNADFDKCLSVDGDSQGVERVYGALSAYMWPGMVLKTGNNMRESSLVDKEDLSDEESDYESEYEILSRGSAEPWDNMDESWVALNDFPAPINTGDEWSDFAAATDVGDGSTYGSIPIHDQDQKVITSDDAAESQISSSKAQVPEESEIKAPKSSDSNNEMHLGYEDLEQLMCEISLMRENLKLMPDFQRKETAAKVAMKMASMFADSSDDESFK